MAGLPANLVFGPPPPKVPSPGHGQTKATPNAKQKPKGDASSWRAEYERVKDSLVVTVPAGGGASQPSEWRADLERAKATLQSLDSSAAGARAALEDLGTGLTSKLQQLGSLEDAVNLELQCSREASSALSAQLAALQQEHDSRTNYVAELQKELAFLNGEMEERRRQLEEEGNNLSSAKPVARLRAAVSALKQELLQMDVRTGVLQHLLLKTCVAAQAD